MSQSELFDPARHEPLAPLEWDADRAFAMIRAIVADAEAHYDPTRYWRTHPHDLEEGEDPASVATPLYYGACGVIWALHHLQALGAVELTRDYLADLEALRLQNRTCLGATAERDRASYMMGDTPIRMLALMQRRAPEVEDDLEALISSSIDHPARELLLGSPGTMLAALFLHRRTGDERWSHLFRRTAATLRRQLEWSDEHQCAFWTQELYKRRYTFLDAIHGFVGVASPLIAGRDLLEPSDWSEWQRCIVNTVQQTAHRRGDQASWPDQLRYPEGKSQAMLMQFCHGAPGFVICLADLPQPDLDALLIAAGEAIWAAGPLTKGSNLCHGTGGNGYAFLKLHRRTGDPRWLDRARAFAMHGIVQTEQAAKHHGQMRHSLWTGDPGFALYLWDCIHARAEFPTLDVFYA